jgi:hypothetical protein
MYRTTYFFFPLLFWVFTEHSLKAQSHFVPATIYLNTSDSMVGWVDKDGWDKFPDRIRFKINESDRYGNFYSPKNIAGWRISNGTAYQTYAGLLDSTHLVIVKKLNAKYPAPVTDTVFIELLVNGKIKLYHTIDKKGITHFFFLKEQQSPEELHYYEFVAYTEGSTRGMYNEIVTQRVERKLFKQQMLTAFSDNQPLYEKLADTNIHFTRKELTKWFTEYNRTTFPASENETAEPGKAKKGIGGK